MKGPCLWGRAGLCWGGAGDDAPGPSAPGTGSPTPEPTCPPAAKLERMAQKPPRAQAWTPGPTGKPCLDESPLSSRGGGTPRRADKTNAPLPCTRSGLHTIFTSERATPGLGSHTPPLRSPCLKSKRATDRHCQVAARPLPVLRPHPAPSLPP